MIILGIDLGKARTGVAICDKGELLASPLTVVQEHNRERLVERLAALAREHGAQRLAVGLPRNMDGSEGESAQNARDIGALLEAATGLPVEFVDERGTTVTAHGYLNETNTRASAARPWWTPWPPPSSSKTIWTTAGCTSRKFDTGKITKQVYIFRKIQYTYSK